MRKSVGKKGRLSMWVDIVPLELEKEEVKETTIR